MDVFAKLRLASWLVIAGGAVAAGIWVARSFHDLFPLDLSHPPTFITGLQLRAVSGEPALCYAALDRGGVAHSPVAREVSDGCGYEDGARLGGGDDHGTGTVLRCPAMAAYVIWQRHVVAPAAEAHFGSPVAAIRDMGTYACRNINHREAGRRSQHATANAIDIAGFRLADGTEISVLDHWAGEGPRSAFLRDIRDGACGLFSAVLSPDYNALHRDHFHFDMGRWRACR